MKTSPADVRERLLDAIDAGLPQGDAAERFGVHRATRSRWAQRRRRPGSAAPTPRRGRARVLDDVALAAHVAAHADATLAEHCATLEATQSRRVSEATMSRSLTQIGWPLKKPVVATEQDSAARAAWREQATQLERIPEVMSGSRRGGRKPGRRRA